MDSTSFRHSTTQPTSGDNASSTSSFSMSATSPTAVYAPSLDQTTRSSWSSGSSRSSSPRPRRLSVLSIHSSPSDTSISSSSSNGNDNDDSSSYETSLNNDDSLSLPLTIEDDNTSAKRKLPRRSAKIVVAFCLLAMASTVCSFLLLPKCDSSTNKLRWVPSIGFTMVNSCFQKSKVEGYDFVSLPNETISVVLINHDRPRAIRESSAMKTLTAHPSVGEILLLHSNPKSAFLFEHEKVINLNATKQMGDIGLSLKFYFCQTAKNDWILHLDDDIEFTKAALDELIVEFSKNTHRLVGKYGRNLTPSNRKFNGYDSTDRRESTEVVLTNFMLMQREMCTAFFHYSDLLWNDVVLTESEGPLWSGEDIYMSLVANHVYGGGDSNNYAMNWLDVWKVDDSRKEESDLDGKLKLEISTEGVQFWSWEWWQTLLRRNRYYAHRGQLWQTGKERLEMLK